MQATPQDNATPNDASRPDVVRKSQFAVVPMWVHRRIVATRTRTMALSVYVELVGQYAGSTRDAEGLRVWPEIQQIADSMEVPKRNIERALAVLIDCGVVLKKRTVRRNQYWLPQEDPDAFAKTLADFQSATSGGPYVQSATSGGLETATSGGSRSATSGGLCKPDPSIQTQEISLSSVVTKAEDARALGAVTERENLAAPKDKPATPVPAPRRGEQPQQPQVAVSAPQQARTVPAPQDAPHTAPQTPQTAPTAPQRPTGSPSPADRVVNAYTAALGRPIPPSTRSRMHQAAIELLAAGIPAEWLADRAREMATAGKGWTDLARHVEHSTAPLPGAAPATAAGSGLPAWCGQCGDGMPAQHNPRFRRTDDGALCHCHPDAVEQQRTRRGGHQPHRDPVDQSVYDLDFNGRPLPA